MSTLPETRLTRAAASSAARSARAGDLVVGRFELEWLAGSGGMGAVWRAHDRLGGAVVALKLMHGGDRDRVARFEREAIVLAELDHPAIVRYLGHGRTEHGGSFLAMEWVDGEELAARLLRGPLSVGEALDLVTRVAGGLRSLHERRMVHRDIKPANLLLERGSMERVKIVDFGLARPIEVDVALTRTGALVGTPGYMAPEQVEGWALEASADVFALGCVLYRCLSGRSPFPGEDADSILDKLVLDDPPALAAVAPHVPAGLSQLVMRMIAKDPDQRPADAGAVLDQLAATGDHSATVRTAPEPVPLVEATGPGFGPGERVGDRYRLERRLSKSLMSSVWVAIDERLERRVAVKLLAQSLVASSAARARFEAEATAAARLRSHHLVQLFDYGIEQGTPFMVMELLDGESLADRLARRGSLPLDEVLSIALGVCRGLSAAHREGVLHRDIKPSNIFLTRMHGEPGETAKLLDFGLAKLMDPRATALTEPGRVVGSMPYMSPEQVRCEHPLDRRTDLWSLAATLYEATVGRAPFGIDALALMRIAHEAFELPSKAVPGLPEELDAFFSRALARPRDERFASAEELGSALETTARRATQRKRPARRRKLGAAFFAVAVAAAAAAAAATGITAVLHSAGETRRIDTTRLTPDARALERWALPARSQVPPPPVQRAPENDPPRRPPPRARRPRPSMFGY